jgi:hypothetical protein
MICMQNVGEATLPEVDDSYCIGEVQYIGHPWETLEGAVATVGAAAWETLEGWLPHPVMGQARPHAGGGPGPSAANIIELYSNTKEHPRLTGM